MKQVLDRGIILKGRYSIEETIKTDDKNYIAYFCVDAMTNERVIVKEFFPDYAMRAADGSVSYNEDFVQDLKNFSVANALAQRFGSLPTIPAAFDIFEENNTSYAACESFDGASVYELIKSGKSFSYDSVRKMMITLLKTSQAFGKVGISYSGFSPDDVWVTSDGYIKLTDYEAMADKTSESDAVKAVASVAYFMLMGEKVPAIAKNIKITRKDVPSDMAKYIVGVLSGKIVCSCVDEFLDDIAANFKKTKKKPEPKAVQSGTSQTSAEVKGKKSKKVMLFSIIGAVLLLVAISASVFVMLQGVVAETNTSLDSIEYKIDGVNMPVKKAEEFTRINAFANEYTVTIEGVNETAQTLSLMPKSVNDNVKIERISADGTAVEFAKNAYSDIALVGGAAEFDIKVSVESLWGIISSNSVYHLQCTSKILPKLTGLMYTVSGNEPVSIFEDAKKEYSVELESYETNVTIAPEYDSALYSLEMKNGDAVVENGALTVSDGTVISVILTDINDPLNTNTYNVNFAVKQVVVTPAPAGYTNIPVVQPNIPASAPAVATPTPAPTQAPTAEEPLASPDVTPDPSASPEANAPVTNSTPAPSVEPTPTPTPVPAMPTPTPVVTPVPTPDGL